MGIFTLESGVPFASAPFFQDFSATLAQIPDSYTEIAFAAPDGSKFNQAIYFSPLTPEKLATLHQSPRNVSFLNGCPKSRLLVQPDLLQRRMTKNSSLSEKNIVSFDTDFKTFVPNWLSFSPSIKRQKAQELYQALQQKSRDHDLPLWFVLYSGNGLHLHFKTTIPLPTQNYSPLYLSILGYLECILGLPFDRVCCNPARLMRLPLSTNWKEASHPIPTEVFFYNPEADAATFFLPFQKKNQLVPNKAIGGAKHKLHSELDLRKILAFFSYDKFESWTETQDKILCSSPFGADKTPSFYFCKSRKLFCDFSSDRGGDLFSLIAHLANVDCRKEFKTVLQYAHKILGKTPEAASQEISGSFQLKDSGVWFLGSSSEDQEEGIWVCSPLEVTGYTRNHQNESWGRQLSFTDPDGYIKTWTMGMEYLGGDALELRKELLQRGVLLNMSRHLRHLLPHYLLTATHSERFRSVSRIGWMGKAFVFPDEVISAEETEKVYFQGSEASHIYGVRGTLSQWQKEVARPCAGNSRLILALCTALAPPLLYLTGDENFGIHLVGPSSIGKTIALTVAGSVWGGGRLGGYRAHWRTTLNGLEGLAIQHHDALLVLDELGEVAPQEAGNAAYMLANGSGKVRGTKDGGMKESEEWRLIFLSAGEVDLAGHMQTVGEKIRAGQEVRMIPVEADAGGGLGILDTLHDFPTSGALVEHLRLQSLQLYGSPIRAFLHQLVKDTQIQAKFEASRVRFRERFRTQSLHSQHQRVLHRFHLLAFAGELARDYRILPFGGITEALTSCFQCWLDQCNTGEDMESTRILTQVRGFFQKSGATDFPLITQDTGAPLHRCLGFRQQNTQGTFDWLVPTEIFRKEICQGYEVKQVIQVLTKGGHLIENKSQVKRLPVLGLVRVYQIRAAILVGSTEFVTSVAPVEMEM